MNGIRMNPIKLQQICSEMDAWPKAEGVWEVCAFFLGGSFPVGPVWLLLGPPSFL